MSCHFIVALLLVFPSFNKVAKTWILVYCNFVLVVSTGEIVLCHLLPK